MDKKTIVVASANKGKLREISEMLPDFNVIGYKDAGLNFDIEETGKTFRENALIKARAVCAALNLPALADDSGLCVDALGGAPGIYSARYSDGGDDGNIDKLLAEMENVKEPAKRKAKFVCSMAYCTPDGKTVFADGETHGRILRKRSGKHGFGYDPVFYSDDLKKSMGLADDAEKNSVSHRGRALKKIIAEIAKTM